MYKVSSNHNKIIDVFVKTAGKLEVVKLVPKASTESDEITDQMVNMINLKLITVKKISVTPNKSSSAVVNRTANSRKGGKK